MAEEDKKNLKPEHPPSVVGIRSGGGLKKWFGMIVFLIFILAFLKTETTAFASICGALLIIISVLIPVYLWCSAKAFGMPIFPFYCVTYLWTFAFQLLSKNPSVREFPPESHLIAGATVAMFITVGTVVWYQFVKRPPRTPRRFRAMSGNRGEKFFLYALLVGIFFNMNAVGGWLQIAGGLFSIVRGIVLGLNALGTFVLSFRMGRRELSRNQAVLFVLSVIVFIITDAVSLFLVGTLSIFLITHAAFILGRKKIPWLSLIVGVLCFSFLHYGKARMRENYWRPDAPFMLQPAQYPGFYKEWFDYSVQGFKSKEEDESPQSFLERSSLVHLLLMAQAESPKRIPYLKGETYAIISQLLLPRIFNPEKIASHEGTRRLNIHYGLQTPEQTYQTTIGWGLLNEAFANYGFLGCLGLGIILGGFYGWATRWSANVPLLSARAMFSILLMAYAMQTEFSAGVYVAALYQSSIALMMISLLFMKVYRSQ